MTAPPAAPYRTFITEVRPRTPNGRAPKAATGDDVEVSALLVRDGHGILAAQLRWRRVDGGGRRKWTSVPMDVDEHGRATATLTAGEPGAYEFEIAAWEDRFATWRRDLRLRVAAGEDVATELLDGADLLERILPEVRKGRRSRVRDAIEQLRATSCGEGVRVAAGLDDAVAEVVVGLPDPEDRTTSGPHPLRVDRELAVRGAWYELFPRSEGGFVEGARIWDRLERIAEAGFDVLYLPPIHPIGTTHRKGRNNAVVAGPAVVAGAAVVVVSSSPPHAAAPIAVTSKTIKSVPTSSLFMGFSSFPSRIPRTPS